MTLVVLMEYRNGRSRSSPALSGTYRRSLRSPRPLSFPISGCAPIAGRPYGQILQNRIAAPPCGSLPSSAQPPRTQANSSISSFASATPQRVPTWRWERWSKPGSMASATGCGFSPRPQKSIWEMTPEEPHAAGIEDLPGSLAEALARFEADEALRASLGPAGERLSASTQIGDQRSQGRERRGDLRALCGRLLGGSRE